MKRKGILTNKQWSILGYVFLFCCTTGILYHAPLISDDFEFADYGYAKLTQVLPYVLYYGNGRLLGNIGAVWLINYPFICAAVKAAMICGIIWALPRAAGIQHKPECALLSALLVLLMNPHIFAQVFTWTSGFMNYVPPVLTMLLCVILVRSEGCVSPVRLLVLGLVGFAGQLFVEHATVIHIIIASLLLVLYLKEKDPSRSRYALCWLVAALAGALVMFAIPKIFFLEENRVSGYRVFHLADVVSYAAKSALLMLHTLGRNPILFVLLSLFAKGLRNSRGKGFDWKSCVYLAYPLVSGMFLVIEGTEGVLRAVRYLALYGGLAVYALCLILDIWKYTDRTDNREMLALIGLAVVSLVPFLIISPFAERCVFLCYCLLCLLLLRGLQYLQEKEIFVLAKPAVWLCTAVILGGLVFLGSEFVQMRAYDIQRDTYIKEQMAKGETEITIFDIPSRYAFTTYLAGTYYYDTVRQDTNFTVVSYEQWVELTKTK